jgi:hypothetical protein|tara:strand:- start:952 stop:1104 length:153 start_codon:yes stop_codon:yes gene_type:complete
LFDSFGQFGPFLIRYDAWNKLKRDQAFLRRRLSINIEGDAGSAKERFGFF